MSGATYQKEREGTYVLMTEHGCGDKPAWKQENGPNYIYEFELYERGVRNRWVVGPTHCGINTGRLRQMAMGESISTVNFNLVSKLNN